MAFCLNDILNNQNQLIIKTLTSIVQKLDTLDKLYNTYSTKIHNNCIDVEIIEIDCKNLREERQNRNNKQVLDKIIEKDIQEIKKICNQKELTRVLSQTNITESELIKKCDDMTFAIVLSGRISINASRQGSKDENFILSICNETTSKFGIYIKNLTSNAYRPTIDGRIIDNNKTEQKHKCLKSFDAKITGKVSGWLFAKITFSNGGHQDNVFREAHEMCRWVCKYGEKNLIFIILIDTDLINLFNELKNSYNNKNLLIVNHIELQQYFIANFVKL